ncbi:MAG TPA: hypothetical protein VGN83_00255 [Falsiroseomonas sp.]|jgi:hypothetical protein|nr:hypothetical protein [Falsiroseomonas sp.]
MTVRLHAPLLAGTGPRDSARRGAALDRGRRWLLAAHVVGFVALPFLSSSVFPSQDGPAHLHTASLLAGLREGGSPTGARFLEEVDPGLTNTAAYWLLSGLMEVMPPIRAEWTMALLLTLLLVGVVLAAPRLLGGRMVDAAPGLLLCAPLMLQMGSFALVLAMAPAFLALVFAARVVRGGGMRDAATFAVLGLLGCALQIQVAPALLAAVSGGAVGAVGWRWLRGGGFVVPRQFLVLALASLPVAAAAVAYAAGKTPEHSAWAIRWDALIQAAILALRGDVVWFSLAEPVALGLATATLGLAALAWLLRDRPSAEPDSEGVRHQRHWLLFGAIAVAGAVMVLPRETAAVPQIPQRLAPFAHLLLFLWFVATPLPPRWRRATLATAIAAGLLLTASRSIGHAVLERRLLAELSWAESQIPSGRVVALVHLPAILDVKGPALTLGGVPLRFDPATHLGRGIAGRDVVDLSNYQVMPIWRLFRVRLRREVHAPIPDLTEFSVMIEDGSLPAGLEAFQSSLRQATGREIETVVVWTGGLDPAKARAGHPHLDTFLRDLGNGFRRTGRSSPAGLAEVWQRMTPP